MKRMKKLIAALMAVAMIASLNISAFATGGYVAKGTAETSYGTTVTAAAASHSATGDVTTEGAIPDGIISVVMPTYANNQFNLMLDPHDLLKTVISNTATRETLSSRLGERFTKEVAEAAQRAYFVNHTLGDTGYTNEISGYSKTSDNLTVKNKSTWPIDVTLVAELDKTSAQDIKLVGDSSALDNEAGAAMYLAVQTTESTPKVAAVETPSDGDYPVPTITLTDTGHLIIGQPVFTYDETNAPLTKDKRAVATALATASHNQIKAKVTLTAASGTTPASVKIENDSSTITENDNGYTLKWDKVGGTLGAVATTADATNTGYIEIQKSSKTVAKVSFNYDAVALSKLSAAGSFTLAFTAPDTNKLYATVDAKVDNDANAYQIQYKASDNTYEQVTTTAASDTSYSWPSLSFNLTAAINGSDDWDDITATNAVTAIDNLKVKSVWDIAIHKEDKDPTVKVTQYAAAAADEAIIKVKLGSGSKEAYAVQYFTFGASGSEKKYVVDTVNVKASGTVATSTDTTYTIPVVKAWFEAGGDLTVTFLLKDGTTKDVTTNVKGDY